jgi:hypothetical protein
VEWTAQTKGWSSQQQWVQHYSPASLPHIAAQRSFCSRAAAESSNNDPGAAAKVGQSHPIKNVALRWQVSRPRHRSLPVGCVAASLINIIIIALTSFTLYCMSSVEPTTAPPPPDTCIMHARTHARTNERTHNPPFLFGVLVPRPHTPCHVLTSCKSPPSPPPWCIRALSPLALALPVASALVYPPLTSCTQRSPPNM